MKRILTDNTFSNKVFVANVVMRILRDNGELGEILDVLIDDGGRCIHVTIEANGLMSRVGVLVGQVFGDEDGANKHAEGDGIFKFVFLNNKYFE